MADDESLKPALDLVIISAPEEVEQKFEEFVCTEEQKRIIRKISTAREHREVLRRHRIHEVGKLLFVGSDAREEGRDGSSRRIDAWPLMRYERDREGSVSFQTLALVEAILLRNEWIERNFSPLWALYTYRANPAGESVHSFLWNLVRHEETQGARAIEVLGPLFAFRETGAGAQMSWLGGLVRYDVKGGVRSLRFGVWDVVTWTDAPQALAAVDATGSVR